MSTATQPHSRRPKAAPSAVAAKDATALDYAPGSMIAAKYRLERVLGAGGMGTVWLARNVVLDFPVALKLILPSIRAAPDMVERLLVEARVEAKLHHDNIVRVFDFGEAEVGSPFIVMELLEGQTLGDLLDQRGKLDATVAVQLLLPVINALDHAHKAGVVHQDLKPDNIFLARGAFGVVPKILDFGIAKLMSSDATPGSDGPDFVMGSPAYMAPEQARGLRDVDQRADVFAISEVLHECVSGERAFKGKNQESMLRSVIEDDVLPLPQNDACLASLWSVLRWGLVRDRDARVASMVELGSALATWLFEQGVHEDVMGVPLARTFRLRASSVFPRRPQARPRRPVVFEMCAAATPVAQPRTPPGPTQPRHPKITRTRTARLIRAWVIGIAVLALVLASTGHSATPNSTPSRTSTERAAEDSNE